MKRLFPLFGGAYLVFLGWYGTRYFGADWRQDLLAAVLGVYLVVSILVHALERRVRSHIDAHAIAELAAVNADFASFLDDRPRGNERVDWGWRIQDIATALALMFYPSLGYTVWRYRDVKQCQCD